MKVSLTEFHAEVEAFRARLSGQQPEHLYESYCDSDPYGEIPKTLLHSGHLASYALATGMIDPFHIENLTKPATYLVPLGGWVLYRDASGSVNRFKLSNLGVDGDKTFRGLRLNRTLCVTSH